MKVNNFNSKVNLPKFCSRLSYSDYQFLKIPTFGWFAYNKDKSFIGNIFEIVKKEDKHQLYSIISKEAPEYLDFDLAYSDIAESRLRYDLLSISLWTGMYALAKTQWDSYKVNFQGKKVLLRDVLIEHGMGKMIENGVGIITQHVLDSFNMLPWPKSEELRGKLLMPSWCTPQHICSLEYFTWDKPNELHYLWLNDEKGWYGDITSGYVLSDVSEFSTKNGFTWDYKADYWTNDKVVTLSDFLHIEKCIDIWSTSKFTAFNKHPLKHVVDTGNTDKLKNFVGKLTYSQILDAEQITGQKLTSHWRRVREEEVEIGGHTYSKRDNCYYVFKKGRLEQVTNFAIEIERIVKQGDKFSRVGLIHYKNQVVPFEMDERNFETPYRFLQGIKKKFITAGLGIPLIHNDFASRALLIVNSFNSTAPIVLGVEEVAPFALTDE